MALELVPRYAKVSQDGAYRPWTESAMSMVGYRCSSMRGFIDPDLMTALTMPIKPTAQGEQFPCQFSIGHTTTRWLVEPIGVGTTVGGSGSPCSTARKGHRFRHVHIGFRGLRWVVQDNNQVILFACNRHHHPPAMGRGGQAVLLSHSLLPSILPSHLYGLTVASYNISSSSPQQHTFA